jgi:RND family efflux transporter MFP subunit
MNKKPCLVFAIVLTFLSACKNNLNNSEEAKFPITKAIIKDTSYTEDYVADIHSFQNVEIRARVKGYIEKIHVDEGAFVKEGQIIFSISKREYEEEVQKAKALLKNAIADAKAAEYEVQNVGSLVDKNVVSKTELDIAKAKLEALHAKIDEAKSMEASAMLRLSFTEVKAPFDGIIDRIPNKIGSLVDEGTLLTTVSDNRSVYAYFHVSEKEYLDLVGDSKDSIKNKELQLILANGVGHKYLGKIEIIEGEFDNSTGNIAFRAKFPNPEKILKHGSSGKVRLKKNLPKSLIIPQKAVFEIQDKSYVYLVNDSNVVTMKNIKIKNRIPHLFILDGSLNTSDKIIFEGIQTIKDGSKINVAFVEMNDIIKELAQQ